ncbi:MAG: hypothetical protein HOV83_05420 [Catenulispora sp.]|nr:hypothetical protein [Catenulispora sp.]
MIPGPGEVLHFSEDPTITVFHPHVAATARQADAYGWAVDEHDAPSYWVPRQCPRAMAWADPATTPDDALRLLGPGTPRVHTIEYAWLPALQTTTLYAYRLPRDAFRPLEGGAAWVATETVTPLGPAENVGDLLEVHHRAGIQLRLEDRLWPWWDAVIDSTLGFSGIRLAHGRDFPY